ncbi:MAG: phosphoenolpyruvate carboxykinase (GTP) [Candidatus Diapherotrites archaeon]|nr:phosphoenolpyruvate carboxykinase (GTP) [Candidatus Diapherotrites archaeon]
MVETINAGLAKNAFLKKWVEECAELCQPERIWWMDGSEEEKEKLTDEAYKTGDFIKLNQEKLPGCNLHRSAVNDVARTEQLTFICTAQKDDAGPMNNWMAPDEAYAKLSGIFRDSMKGRTMFVIPFSMGPLHSPFRKIGVQISDSHYVALNMRIMTRIGKKVLEALGDSDDFTKCLHGKAELDMEKRFICHFPEDNAVWSVGSGYGGNALLGKKCLALRIASYLGKKEGWMAEHMLIMGVQNPEGKTHFIAAAFPSACGKTNLAMLIPPAEFRGWKIWTIGDDIAWIRIEKDGRMYAVNPENGFFGVAPQTSYRTNPNAMKTIGKNTIFTNVLLRDDGTVWWEGMEEAPAKGTDWKGEPWTPQKGEPGAHPNSRFTAPVSQCPSLYPDWENPKGVPLSAIIFGGRRATTMPLVFEAFDWQHGTFVGATMSSEKTAAAVGKVGEVRRDPMAMLPFCGYHMGDYFRHWLDMGKKAENCPKIFHVNWFRKDGNGKFLWPGFGENLRVLKWVIERCEGNGRAEKTAIGFVPEKGAIDTHGISVSESQMLELLKVDKAEWAGETKSQLELLDKIGERLPKEIREEHEKLAHRLQSQ